MALPEPPCTKHVRFKDDIDNFARERDGVKKQYMKDYADKHAHAKESEIATGDKVLVSQPRTHKFDPNPYIVEETQGTMVTARHGDHKITRNKSFFKGISPSCGPAVPERGQGDEEEEIVDQALKSSQHESQGMSTEPTHANLSSSTPVRKSSRTIKIPQRLADYVCS
jgi:hypothetical protein